MKLRSKINKCFERTEKKKTFKIDILFEKGSLREREKKKKGQILVGNAKV